MAQLGDYRFRQDSQAAAPEPPSSGLGSSALVWTLVGVAGIALGAVLYFYFRPASPAPPADTSRKVVAETTEEVAPAAKTPESLPPLDGSDALVRDLIKGLSSRPELVTWLADEDLVRAFVAMVDNIAEGASPRSFLTDFTPDEGFHASGDGNRFSTDPRSFARYNSAAGAFASLDTAGVGRAYERLGPLCESAYRELGMEGNFHGALERAIGRLLATPDVPADAPIIWNFVTYQYADERLESLSAAEKQFLRMGPHNVAIVKNKLRELATAMGLTPRTPSE